MIVHNVEKGIGTETLLRDIELFTSYELIIKDYDKEQKVIFRRESIERLYELLHKCFGKYNEEIAP